MQKDFDMWHFNYIIEQIKLADTKMNFLLAIYSSLLGIIIINFSYLWETIYNLEHLLLKIILIFLIVLFGVGIFYFYYLFASAVGPRIFPRKILKDDNYLSPIFWGHIASMTKEKYLNYREEEILEDIKKQIFVNSKIVNEKFKRVKRAYDILFCEILLFVIIFVSIVIIN